MLAARRAEVALDQRSWATNAAGDHLAALPRRAGAPAVVPVVYELTALLNDDFEIPVLAAGRAEVALDQ